MEQLQNAVTLVQDYLLGRDEAVCRFLVSADWLLIMGFGRSVLGCQFF